jgi:hypothetical protein
MDSNERQSHTASPAGIDGLQFEMIGFTLRWAVTLLIPSHDAAVVLILPVKPILGK